MIGPIAFFLGMAFLVFYPCGSSKSSGQRDVAQILTERVYNAAAEYYTIAPPGRGCPTLVDLVLRDLLKPEHTMDPWGTSLVLYCTGDVIEEVRSAGPDGLTGTADDIVYTERREER